MLLVYFIYSKMITISLFLLNFYLDSKSLRFSDPSNTGLPVIFMMLGTGKNEFSECGLDKEMDRNKMGGSR